MSSTILNFDKMLTTIGKQLCETYQDTPGRSSEIIKIVLDVTRKRNDFHVADKTSLFISKADMELYKDLNADVVEYYSKKFIIDSESIGTIVFDKAVLFNDNKLKIQFFITGKNQCFYRDGTCMWHTPKQMEYCECNAICYNHILQNACPICEVQILKVEEEEKENDKKREREEEKEENKSPLKKLSQEF